MKKLLLVLPLFLVTLSPIYSMWQEDKEKLKLETDTIESDSVEYDLIIMELGYDSYLISQPPMSFYTVSYYKQWNNRYVMEWNNRYRIGPKQEIYDSEIYYDYRVDYGIELEYKLYNFFQFFEKKYNVKLVPRAK